MISGAHVILFAEDPQGLRAWLRDVLELPWVDAGEGWPVFALPPAEVAVHPVDGGTPGHRTRHVLYLMCVDLEAAVARLEERGVELAGPITERGWGRLTFLRLPGGGELGLYEPHHPRPASPP